MLQTDELFNKGIHYFNNKNVQAAYDIFLQLNKKEPENIKVLEALASVVAIMGDLNKAGIFFEKALLLEGKKPSVSLLNNYAHLLQRAGDYDKAIIRYE